MYLDRSAKGVIFGVPRLLESFQNPHSVAPPPASPSLIRLSTESVMLTWSSIVGGRWVIRSAAVDQDRVGPATTVSSATGDVLPDDLQPGPKADAMLLWSEPVPAPATAPKHRRDGRTGDLCGQGLPRRGQPGRLRSNRAAGPRRSQNSEA